MTDAKYDKKKMFCLFLLSWFRGDFGNKRNFKNVGDLKIIPKRQIQS
jgi:hypothetical protein